MSGKPEYKWPDTGPIDKSDPYWESNNSFNINGVPYIKAEVSPGKWQWVVDENTQRLDRENDQYKRDLYWALRSRILTDEEMARVKSYGVNLIIESMVPFRTEDKQRELNEALLQQFNMRLAAENAASTKMPTNSKEP